MEQQSRRPGEGDGSNVQLGGERSELNSNLPQSQLETDPIGMMMPWAAPAEKDMRIRLRRCQSLGSTRATSTRSDRARALLWIAAQAASEWTLAPGSVSDLREVRNACLRLFQAANAFERIEGRE